jgi:hypothetical protein
VKVKCEGQELSMAARIEVQYPVYYTVKVLHRDGTVEMTNVLGKRNMSNIERKQFLDDEKRRMKQRALTTSGNVSECMGTITEECEEVTPIETFTPSLSAHQSTSVESPQ